MPSVGRGTASAASADILANYTQLARAYDKTDEVALRTLLAPDFEFDFVPGVKDDLTQYVGDWKFEKQHALDERVSIRVLHLALHADVADAEILLTRTYPLSAPGAIEVQRERDRWELRNGRWLLASAQTLTNTVSVDGKVVTSDGPSRPLSAKQRAAVAAQLSEAAWPIDTAAPGNSLQDLDPLYDAIGPARIVAMGEATHGTSEFFSLKDRIFRLLVERMGFTVFAMGTPWRDGLAVDRYVTTGQGSARAALAGLLPIWDTREVLDLIEWMRAYNLTRGARPMLRFVGIDMQDNPVILEDDILSFIWAARPADLAPATTHLHNLLQFDKSNAEQAADVAAVEKMLAADDTAVAPERALQLEHSLEILRQVAEMKTDSDETDQGNSRDRSMAQNVQWVATTLFPHARIAVWAHDGQ